MDNLLGAMPPVAVMGFLLMGGGAWALFLVTSTKAPYEKGVKRIYTRLSWIAFVLGAIAFISSLAFAAVALLNEFKVYLPTVNIDWSVFVWFGIAILVNLVVYFLIGFIAPLVQHIFPKSRERKMTEDTDKRIREIGEEQARGLAKLGEVISLIQEENKASSTLLTKVERQVAETEKALAEAEAVKTEAEEVLERVNKMTRGNKTE